MLKLENALCSSGGDNKTATAFTAQSHETTITRPLGMRLDMCEETFPPKQPLAPANSLADKGSAQLSRHHSEQLNKTGWKESILSGNEHVSKPTKEEMSESKQKNSDKKGSSNTQGEQGNGVVHVTQKSLPDNTTSSVIIRVVDSKLYNTIMQLVIVHRYIAYRFLVYDVWQVMGMIWSVMTIV